MKKFKLKALVLKANVLTALFLWCLIYGCTGPDSGRDQSNRFLQEVDLKHADNKPYFSNSYMLTRLTERGILAGKIKPVLIDYKASTVKPVSVAEFNKLMELPPVKNYLGELEPARVHPGELTHLVLDVSKQEGKVTDINYVNFWGKTSDSENNKYYFSVSFPELANYLNETNSLWVKNMHPMVWKNQVVHTDTRYVEELLPELFNKDNTYNIARFKEGKPFQKEEVEIYNYDYELKDKLDYVKLASGTAGGEINLMSNALLSGQYTHQKEVPAATTLAFPEQEIEDQQDPDQFEVVYKEELDLEHPKNNKFFKPNQELSALIMKAYESGLLKDIYHTDSLNRKMTRVDWKERLSYKLPTDSDDKAPYLSFTSLQIPYVQIGWKTDFNQKGEITHTEPQVLTLSVSHKYHPAGIMMPIASFRYPDVEKALQQMPEYKNGNQNMLADLRNRNYFAFFVSTSGIKPANKPSAI